METINHFGIVKKKHTYLYNNFNDTMNEDFRKLKGRFYKKTNYWVFPFVKGENKEGNDNTGGLTLALEKEPLVSNDQNPPDQNEIVSIGVQTDEEGSMDSSKIVKEDDTLSVQTKTSIVSECYDSENVIIDNFSDHLSSIIETDSISSGQETLQIEEGTTNQAKAEYKFKPPTIFYHQVANYF